MRERCDVLVNHHTVGIHQEGLGRAIDTPIDGDPTVAVEGAFLVGVSQLLEPLDRERTVVFPVEAENRHHIRACDLE